MRRSDTFNPRQDSLWQAVTDKDLPTIQHIVETHNIDVNFKAPDGWVNAPGGGGKTLLHHAAWVGDLAVFRYLVEKGADYCQPRQRNWARAKGFTPFHHACFYNRLPIVQFCIDKGVDVNSIGEDGFTPLHLCAKFNYAELAKCLLAAGARTDVPNKQRKTALQIASSDDVAEVLRRAETEQRQSNAHGSETAKPTVCLIQPWLEKDIVGTKATLETSASTSLPMPRFGRRATAQPPVTADEQQTLQEKGSEHMNTGPGGPAPTVSTPAGVHIPGIRHDSGGRRAGMRPKIEVSTRPW